MKSYTQTLIDFALDNWCPGCQIELSELAPATEDSINNYCPCCGWYVWGDPQKPETLSFGSFPVVLAEGTGEPLKFECAINFPEHRERWPKPQSNPDQPDKFSEEELQQEIVEDHPHHYYILRDETCGLCGSWAPHKIAEEMNVYDRHPYTSQLCCDCFEDIFGPISHQGYDKVYSKPTPGENK